MKRFISLLIAGSIAAIVLGLTAAIPVLIKPSFILYVIVVAIATVVYDYGPRHRFL